MGVTVLLGLAVIVAGIAAGLALAVLRAVGLRAVDWAIVAVVDVLRALAPLVIIVLIFFGLPGAGVQLSGFAAAWLALSLVLMAFAEEIFWAGITAVPRGSGKRRARSAFASGGCCSRWCCRRRCAWSSRR